MNPFSLLSPLQWLNERSRWNLWCSRQVIWHDSNLCSWYLGFLEELLSENYSIPKPAEYTLLPLGTAILKTTSETFWVRASPCRTIRSSTYISWMSYGAKIKCRNQMLRVFIILSYLEKSGAFSSGDLVLACLTLIQKKITSKEEDLEKMDFFFF